MRNSTSPLAAPMSGAGSSGGASHVGPANAIDDEQRENDALLDAPIGPRAEVSAGMKALAVPVNGSHTRKSGSPHSPRVASNLPGVRPDPAGFLVTEGTL